jgi:hypothetical protein
MVIRMAIEAYESRGGRTARKSFLAQARDLAGVVEGPPDVSTNRRHLRGYGR